MMSFGEALDRYEQYARARGFTDATVSHTRRCVRLFDNFLDLGGDITRVTVQDFRRFLGDLRQRPQRRPFKDGTPRRLSGTSINTYARAIRAFFSWLAVEGIIPANPLSAEPAPKKPRKLPGVYPETSVKAFLVAAATNKRDKAIVFLFLDSGLRLSELSQLDCIVVNTAEGTARVMGKGNKERLVPFNKLTAAAIDDYVNHTRPESRGPDRLFLKSNGYPLSGRGIQSMLERLGKKAGMKERLSPHKLRHTCATLSLKYGSNLEYVKHILGHRDVKTTSESYLNVDYTDIKAAHDKFSPISKLADKKVPAEDLSDDRQPDRPPGKADKSSERTGLAEDNSRFILRYENLWREHTQKLAILAGKLASDIENGNLEWHRHPQKASPGPFDGLNLAQVFAAQNNRLWPYLAQHLDNEFITPKLSQQISRVAAKYQVAHYVNKATKDNELIETVCQKLILVSERGTFEGICEICRNYPVDLSQK